MKRKLLILCTCMALLITACGNQNNNETQQPKSDETNQDTVTPAPESAAEPTPLATPTPVAALPSDALDVYYEKFYNNARDYKNKTVKFSAKISYIEEDCFTVYEDEIYITLADITKTKELKVGQYVTVIGLASEHDFITNAVIIAIGETAKKTMEQQKKHYDKEKKEEAKKVATEKKKKEATKKKKKEAAKAKFINACKTYSYKNLARHPKKYKGKKIKIQVKISQVVDDWVKYYRCYTRSAYGWYGNEFIINDLRTSKTKILKDDIITVYGTYIGTTKIERALTGVSEEVPAINMKYCKIN